MKCMKTPDWFEIAGAGTGSVKEPPIKILSDSAKIRLDREKKLKRVFNFDSEIPFIKSYRKLKKKMSLDEFEINVKINLVDTKMVSKVVFEWYMNEERIHEEIKSKISEREKLKSTLLDLEDEIGQLQLSLDEDEDEDNDKFINYFD